MKDSCHQRQAKKTQLLGDHRDHAAGGDIHRLTNYFLTVAPLNDASSMEHLMLALWKHFSLQITSATDVFRGTSQRLPWHQDRHITWPSRAP